MILLNSIRNKILIFAILATLIPSVGLGLLSYWQNEAMIAENVTHQLHTLASDANRELEHWFTERVEGLRALSGSDAIINTLSYQSSPPSGISTEDPQMLSRYLRLVEEKLDPLLELMVLDATGQIVASSGGVATASMLPVSWSATAATEGIIIVPPHWDETHDTTTFTLAVPVLSLGNKTLGALAAVVDLGTVQPRLMRAANSSPGSVRLLDLTGRPLLGTAGLITALLPIETEVLQRLRTQGDEPMIFKGQLHRTVLGITKVSPALPVIVVVERDRADIYQAWTAFRNLFLALVGGLTLLVGLVAWRMGRSIVTPLESLTRAAGRIAAGDLAMQLPVVRHDELGRLTQVFNQMADNLRHSHEEFEAASLELQKQNQLLETLSVTDSLTGLYNRKKLDDILAHQFARFKRNQRLFSVLMMDIDHFKILNDTYGHLAGDYVLASVAKIFSASIRSIDYAARYGGEEFVIVLPETMISAALEMAERIRAQVQNATYDYNDQSMVVTLSIGVADVCSSDDTASTVIARADQMLYAAKRAGRNQVCCAADVESCGIV
ncbi:MAG: diguanylate cyclase [Pseudomonadota bacterium]|nr:diguanylate cyclase [Pseudomonadota bacterium]